MAVKSEIITITPQMAKRLLDKNKGNRGTRETAIARYAADMANQNWVVNGTAIAVSSDNVLLDGQNRLYACIRAGVPFDTLYVTGLNGGARETIDIGVPRTLVDALGWHGIEAPKASAQTLAYLFRYDKMLELGMRQLVTTGRSSRHEVIAYIDANPEIITSAKFAEELRRRVPAAVGIIGATHALLSRHYSPDTADSFYLEVADPSGDEESSPFLLREWLLDHQTLMARKPATVIFAMNVKAARFYAQGVAVRRLAWKRTGQRKGEEFPRIDLKLA
jgi:hypothetical protein